VAGQFLERKTGFEPVACHRRSAPDRRPPATRRPENCRSGTGVERLLVRSLSGMFSMDYATDRI